MTDCHLFGLDGRPVLDLDRNVVKAMGFELEESQAPYDVWVIERAEKPREN